MPPAIDSPSTSRATPSVTRVASGPSWCSPSPSPAAAMASLISTTRGPPTRANTPATVSSERCTPSAISSTVAAPRAAAASAPRAAPGARWWSGAIPLKRCVTSAGARSRRNRSVVAAVASVWPTATSTPRSARRSASASAPGSSGAIVITRTCPRPASISASARPTSGGRIRVGSWAPHRAAERNGPSRWIAATSPASTASASVATTASIRSGSSVTALATIVVVP